MRNLGLATVLCAALACSTSDQVGHSRIQVTKRARLGDRDGPGMVQQYSSVACTSAGMYYYTDFVRHDLAVFDSAGKFVRTIGREGNGPGEFRQAIPVLIDRDTLYAFDRANARYTVITAKDSVARIVPFTVLGGENPYGLAVLGDGRVVVNGLRRDATSDSLWPLHLIGSDGKLIRSFGERAFTAQDISRRSPPFLRLLARSADGGFWAAHRFEYRIDKWSADGQLERTLTVKADWFPPEPTHPPSGAPDFGPTSGVYVNAVLETEAGLWVIVVVPQLAGRGEGVGTAGNTSLTEDPHRDTRIVLLDPQSGAVRAWVGTDARMERFACANTLVSQVLDSDGFPQVQTWSLKLFP